MTASDDAKFERARREAPHIEAFARIVREPQNDESPPAREGDDGLVSMEAPEESRAE